MRAKTDPHGRHHESSYLGPRQYSLFTLYGFEVKLDLSWLLLALLVTWTLAAGLFPGLYPDLEKTTYWWMGLFGALGLFLSIVIHEFSHSYIARRYGMPIRGITLFIFGGVAEMEEEPPTAESEFWMAIAGPIASFVLGLVFFLLNAMTEALGLEVPIVAVTLYLAQVNILLAVFNLIPAFPLDGGRVLRAALWKWKNSLLYATRVASRIGSGFGIALIALGLLGFAYGNFIGGMWWLLIGTFLRGAAKSSYTHMMTHQTLSGEPIRRFMQPDPVTVPPAMTLQHWVDEYVYRQRHSLFPIVEGSTLLGCITTRELKQVPREEWSRRSVRDSMVSPSPENSVSPDADAEKVFMAMLRPGANARLMVVEGGRLVGTVSFADLREYLALKLDLEPAA